MLRSHLLLQQQLAVLLLQSLQLQAQADSSMICLDCYMGNTADAQ